MKKQLFGIISALTISCSALSGLIGCAQTPPPPPAGASATPITASLLDGKIANLMGAQGLGLDDKESQDGASTYSVSLFDENRNEKQKKHELAKDTEDGIKDVHFHDKDDNVKSYKDLNKKYSKHHHKQVECPKAECDEISDEIELEESQSQEQTVISLDARVNKLYNYGDWTFMSISSAVTGNVSVKTEFNSMPTNFNMPVETIGNANTYVNLEGHISSISPFTYSYIEIPAQDGKERGFIPVKAFDTETGYHTANYWSDDYNQSYIINNATGITYSLSQFPYIYSVENGMIKVYNRMANGLFDYYLPEIHGDNISFSKIELPQHSEVYLPSNYNGVKVDRFGHIIFQVPSMQNNFAGFDENGEKWFGNCLVTNNSKQVYDQLLAQYGNDRNWGNILARRYEQSRRYCLGSDGRMYRVNFKGSFSDVSVSVLNELGEWQSVEQNTNVTFDYLNRAVCYYRSMGPKTSVFSLNKISDGYAYYSTCAQMEGAMVLSGVSLLDNQLENYNEYQGVIKLSVNGADGDNSHLDFLKSIKNEVDFSNAYSTILLGSDKMLYLKGTNMNVAKELWLCDVSTGNYKKIGDCNRIGIGSESIYFDGLGWLNLRDDVDYSTFSSANFTQEELSISARLDAYFRVLSTKTGN